ncbi:MAG TPA: YncE family protein [Pseudonocardiaceae bacterium]
MRTLRPAVRCVLALMLLFVFLVCRSETLTVNSPASAISHSIVAAPIASASRSDGLPGMPPVPVQRNVYADAGAGMLATAVRADRPLVYVPDVRSGDVRVIDPGNYEVLARYPIGREVQHVVPAYDLRTLYATDDRGNRIVPFDPVSGRPGASIPVLDPYNLYFTPNGASAISVAEAHRELIWYDAHSWRQQDITPTPGCAGINHADFTADGRTAVFTCEFAGQVAVIDIASHRLLRMIDMPHRHIHMGPQDIKLAPNGSVFYIADSQENGVWVLDGAATRVLREIPTGRGAHGLYLSRDARRLFVTDRNEGAISVLDADTGGVLAKWPIPGGGSPDMGNVTADGSQLWLSGRYNQVVYVLSTVNGQLISRIPVGPEPHGLCVWPQPGRYSLGHTGITR